MVQYKVDDLTLRKIKLRKLVDFRNCASLRGMTQNFKEFLA
jgi:hypothetical protein